MDVLKRDLKPLDILTREAFLNAIAGISATGSSTNVVLHLLALAREAEIELSIDDFDRISRKTPLLADLKPWGNYLAADLFEAGGIELVAKRLVEGNLVDGTQKTPTGKTLREEALQAIETEGQQVVRPLDQPLKTSGSLVVLQGSFAPEGCVVKITGHEKNSHRGPARVFESEESAMEAVTQGQLKSGDVVVIRYEGPKGGPGMREMLGVTAAIVSVRFSVGKFSPAARLKCRRGYNVQ